jgi:hypothetical protein
MEKKLAPIVVKDIHLLRVEVIQQKLDVIAFKKQKQHQLNVGHKLLHNLNDERIKLEFVFSFDNSKKEPLLFFQIDFHFHINNLPDFYELKEENKPVFSGHFVATLIGICFSTARGIILEKLNNAGIPNIILPVVSPQEMLSNTKPNPTKNE